MPRKNPKMSLQLVKLDPPRGGYCYICGDSDSVVVTADASVDRTICAECAPDALAIEKFMCLAFPEWGMRHPRPYESHTLNIKRQNFL
jgi:hypothetical protein